MASFRSPATAASSSGRHSRPALSSVRWAELPPMTRYTTAASSSESDISFNLSSSRFQRAGGNTKRNC